MAAGPATRATPLQAPGHDTRRMIFPEPAQQAHSPSRGTAGELLSQAARHGPRRQLPAPNIGITPHAALGTSSAESANCCTKHGTVMVAHPAAKHMGIGPGGLGRVLRAAAL